MVTKRGTTATATKQTTTTNKKRSDLVCKVGNIGDEEIELRYTPSGKAVCNFNMAVNTGKGDERTTEWYQVALWEHLAENFMASIDEPKGLSVIVWGVPSVEAYTKNDGTPGKQKKISAWAIGINLNFYTVGDISKVQRIAYNNDEGEDNREEPF